MVLRIAIAFGAGIVSALLFAASAKATALALTLPYLAPLPLVIACLSWGIDMGAIAALVAAGGAAALSDPSSGAVFGCAIALPAWALSALATSRARFFARLGGDGERPLEWCPVGLVVTAAAAIGALIGLSALVSLIVAYSGYENGVQELSKELAPLFQSTFADWVSLPGSMTVEQFANQIVREAPPILAPGAFLLFCFNLYLGARVAQISQALKRPWPDLPEHLVLPRALGAALVLALALALLVADPYRVAAWIVVGAFAMAFVLQGLALAHAMTRGVSYRNPLLFVLYMACSFAPYWLLPALAVAGLTESFLSLRARRVAASNAKTLNQRKS
jgi:hypothetical protein